MDRRWIGGRRYNENVMTPQTFDKINPATGKFLSQHPIATSEEVHSAVQSARMAQQSWKKVSLPERARLLKAIANALYRQADELASVISAEVGKPLTDALESDLGIAISIFRYYAATAPKALAPRRIAPDLMSVLAGRSHREVFQPRGVIGIISPWNYPLAIPASGIAACLAAGNAVVLKPSELSPETGKRLVTVIREVCKAAGVSEDLVQVVTGDASTGQALVQSAVDGLIFTGSGATGRWIEKEAAERGLWCSLELGGSDAMIVLDYCDAERAASYAVWGRFVNAGQACAAVKRLLVPERELDRWLKILRCKTSQIKVGSPDEPDCHYGPLISEKQLLLLESQVQDALEKGAELVTGGQRLAREGYFYPPTILTRIPPDARLLREETFGPVLAVIPYRTVEEAVQITNATQFGLTACVFGPDTKARRLAEQLDCGTVMINDIGASNYAMVCAPWGGWKQSGQGRSHGIRALQELSLRKVVSANARFHWPVLNKPLWLFSKDVPTKDRAQTVLAFASQHLSILNPVTWLAFWRHRSATRI